MEDPHGRPPRVLVLERSRQELRLERWMSDAHAVITSLCGDIEQRHLEECRTMHYIRHCRLERARTSLSLADWYEKHRGERFGQLCDLVESIRHWESGVGWGRTDEERAVLATARGILDRP